MEYECDKIKKAKQKDVDDMINIYLESTTFEEFLVNVDLKVPNATWKEKLPFRIYWFKRSHDILAPLIHSFIVTIMGCSSIFLIYSLAIKPASSYLSPALCFIQIFGTALICICSIICECIWTNGIIAIRLRSEERQK